MLASWVAWVLLRHPLALTLGGVRGVPHAPHGGVLPGPGLDHPTGAHARGAAGATLLGALVGQELGTVGGASTHLKREKRRRTRGEGG